MIRTVSAISVALLVLVSFELYNGVHRVKAQEQALVSMSAQIAREAEQIRVLKAEWSYLNQPDRLQALARRHLALAPTGASQIVVLTSLPIRGDAMSTAPSPVVEAQDLPSRVVTDVPLPRFKPAPPKAVP
ncbi:MAG: hypothetical protein SGI91_18435 [Alphaproteobacteria bacterium]|nr:hypothetical protein [Alphaproteobacteria bacterium]